MSLRAGHWPVWLAEKRAYHQLKLLWKTKTWGNFRGTVKWKVSSTKYKACLAPPLNYIPEQLLTDTSVVLAVIIFYYCPNHRKEDDQHTH